MKKLSLFTLVLSVFTLHLSHGQTQATFIKIKALPENHIYIEKSIAGQHLNFDFLLENTSDDTLMIDIIEVSVLDKKQNLILRKSLNNNGSQASINSLPARQILPHGKLMIFNPLHSFAHDVPLENLKFEFYLYNLKNEDDFAGEMLKPQFVVEKLVSPKNYETKTALILPFKGKAIVYDGHDYLSHHRRFDYSHPFLNSLGFTGNFMRYSYDFILLDNQGKMYKNDPLENEAWYSFGSELVATADGIIRVAYDTMPDNKKFNMDDIEKHQFVIMGNYLIIDHLNGEFSVYGHLQNKSLLVKVGDKIKQGQTIARMGTSGSALMPHLHYELQTSIDHKAEGLPSYFVNFEKSLGEKTMKIKKGQIDTGDIVIAK